MTIGQRIARKRREQNISQEALGEQLGVSRQSVYKWESDTALPEIDKLVAMSRIFSVSVGWLLGVEEDASQPRMGEPQESADSGELTEKQLKMVEEIVDRYIAAQPKPTKKRRWLWVLAGAGLVLVVVFFNLFDRLDRMDNQYNNLQYSVSNVQNDVNRQIGSITNRVEEILKSQNNLAADYGTEILSADLAGNTVTFRVWATPKTYVEGMEAVFQADAGDGLVELAGELGEGREFSAEITCTLTDDITLSVVFVDGDKGETQVLDSYVGLYSGSFPEVDVKGHIFGFKKLDETGSVTWEAEYVYIGEFNSETSATSASVPVAGIKEVRVGFFRNKELVKWLEPCEPPENDNTREGLDFYRLDLTIKPQKDEVYCLGTVVIDQYGREWAYETFDRGTLREWRDGEWELNSAGDGEMTAATGLTVEEWWALPWKYE